MVINFRALRTFLSATLFAFVLGTHIASAQVFFTTAPYTSTDVGQNIIGATETQKFTLTSSSVVTGATFAGLTKPGDITTSLGWAILPGSFTPSSTSFLSSTIPGDTGTSAVTDTFIMTVPAGGNSVDANTDYFSIPSITL